MPDERRAGVPLAREQRERVRRHAGLAQRRDQLERAARRLLGGLEHDRVARGQRRGGHTRRNREREVPGGDDGRDSARNVAQRVALAGRLQEGGSTLELDRAARVVLEKVDRLAHVGVGLGPRLGALAHLQRRQLDAALAQPRGGRAEDPGAFRGGASGPIGGAGDGRRHGRVHVLGAGATRRWPPTGSGRRGRSTRGPRPHRGPPRPTPARAAAAGRPPRPARRRGVRALARAAAPAPARWRTGAGARARPRRPARAPRRGRPGGRERCAPAPPSSSPRRRPRRTRPPPTSSASGTPEAGAPSPRRAVPPP